MTVSLDDLATLLREPEGERLEFKSAQTSYAFDKLAEYCAALANEGGGKIVLGVTDRRPRQIVGTSAFAEPGRTVSGLIERLHIRISTAEINHPDGRVLIFEIPSRPIGVPIAINGKYLARSGDTLRAMTEGELRKVFDEGGADFSAQVERDATLDDLDPVSVELFRKQWIKNSQNQTLASLSVEQLLSDAELLVNGGVTRAALILLGTHAALGRYLGQAEVVFEYRNSDSSISHQQRIEYRQGFLSFLDDLWTTINLRNEVVQFQDGLFRRDIPVMNETAVREAVLNAVTHREYRLLGSVFVKQFPRKLEITSPGGFPAGVTAQNIIRKQSPRNRRIAEACFRCGLVERSGQGADRIFEELLRQGKPKPDFTGTDDYQVSITLQGEIQNPDFLRFLEKVSAQQQLSFSVEDLLVLDAIQREESVPEELKPRLANLLEHGVIERWGRGRGVRIILSRKFYDFIGKRAKYTQAKGLDKEQNKALLLNHIKDSADEGCVLSELEQVVPALSKSQVQKLLQQLKTEGKVKSVGMKRFARWIPAKRMSIAPD